MGGTKSCRMRRFSVRTSVCPSPPPLGHPARPEAQPARPEAQPARPEAGQKISPFYRTLSPIRAAALPAPIKTKEKVEQGKGTADHLMPLGYVLILKNILTKLLPTKVTH